MSSVLKTILLFGLIGSSSLVAEELRIWKDSTGKYEINAAFVELRNGAVKLRRDDGKTLTVKLSKLSEADQELARKMAQKVTTSAANRPNNVANSVRGAVYRNQSIQRMKQLAIALVNYESANGHFPAAAIKTRDKKPGLSWRVAILPYLEQNNLYRQFRLDEPWDSEHNIKLIERMPKAFESPGTGAERGYTNFLTVRMQNSFMSDDNREPRTRDIRDGTSATVGIVEADDDHAVIWTRPDDLEWSSENPAKGLGNIWPGRFHASFIDGSVRAVPMSVSAEELRGIFTRNGGERVRLDSF